MKKDILKYAFVNAFSTTAYIVVLVSVLFNFPRRFLEDAETILAPIMMLMVFVFSAAITATLVLGRPIMWYLDGKKKEALHLFLYTLAVFFVIILLIFSLIVTKVIF
jgi:hypothetical protein